MAGHGVSSTLSPEYQCRQGQDRRPSWCAHYRVQEKLDPSPSENGSGTWNCFYLHQHLFLFFRYTSLHLLVLFVSVVADHPFYICDSSSLCNALLLHFCAPDD